MAVRALILTQANSTAGRMSGNFVRFLCDTEAELPSANVIDGDFALALDTGKPFTRAAGAWVLNTEIDVVAVRLLETGGPTSLLIGSVSDNQFLKRSGTGIVGAAVAGTQAFPVGSVFISAVSTNPATLLGYGTWSAIGAGRVLVGLDAGDPDFDTLEETGGAKTVTLAESQIPAHTHVQNSHNHTQDAHTHVQNSHNHTQDSHNHTQNSFAPRIINSGTAGTVGVQGASAASNANASNAATTATNQVATATNQVATAVNQNATATNQSATAVNQNTGGGGSHSNVQPYFVCMFWRRLT